MPSKLCALPKAAEELLDDIIVPEAAYILEDCDTIPFYYGSAIPIHADELLKEALNHAPEPAGKAWLARIIYPTDGDGKKLLEIARLLLQEFLLPSTFPRFLTKLMFPIPDAYSSERQVLQTYPKRCTFRFEG